jgi:carboxymethylenebutenolidase
VVDKPRNARKIDHRLELRAAVATTVVIPTPDGSLDGYLALPPAGAGPGLIVLQEIFGVGDYIKAATDRLAELGYVALAPDLYWRIERHATPQDLEDAISFAGQLDHAAAVQDSIASLNTLRRRREVTDAKVGAVGFCLGGTVAFGVAIHGDPDTAVCYYGSGIPDMLDQADGISCPVLLHFGGADPYIPRENVDRVARFAAAKSNMECHIQENAGHAFDNPSPMFHVPDAAARAWEITREFLARTLPAA